MFATIYIQSINWVFVSSVFTFVSLTLSIVSFVITTRRDAKLKKIELTPFLVIESMKLKKKNCGDEIYAKRYYNGDYDLRKLSLNDAIEIEKFDLDNLEHFSFMNECRNQYDKIYFSRFNGSRCLVFNMLSSNSVSKDLFYEHCSTEICFVNYGALIKRVSIKSVKCIMDDGNQLEIKGLKNNYLDCVVPTGSTFTLTCDEVAESLDRSLCINNERTYNGFEDEFDFLKKRLPKDSLKYKKLDFIIECYNLAGDVFKYDLTLEKENGVLNSSTQLIKKQD